MRSPSVLFLLLVSADAQAHSFGQTYTLPVPIWLYLYGAAAALVLSFLLVGYFVSARSIGASRGEYDLGRLRVPGPRTRSWLMGSLRALSLGALALTIAAGFWGTDNPYRNINMTLFWVVFCLGFTYTTALLGDWYAVINPFRMIADGLERLRPGLMQGRYPYPRAWGYWPALLLYMAFIWIELFGGAAPRVLSIGLSVYILINVFGCWLVGRAAWFEHGEFLGVFLHMVAKCAPVRVATDADGRMTGLYLRWPFTGLFQERGIPFSLLLFVLFMLSSTAFDGLHETVLWVSAFWKNLYQWLLIPVYGDALQVGYAGIQKLLLAYQTAALLLSPFVYFLVYALFLYLARLVTRTEVSFRQLLLSFGFCLIPIAFAYHFTHYYTLLQTQGVQLLHLVSDPLGLGWNLFGTAPGVTQVIPDMAVVWHTQVLVIVAGHIVSVYLAHLQALQLFPDRRAAVLSQLPTLMLMVGFTSCGLWILSLPLEAGGVVPPGVN